MFDKKKLIELYKTVHKMNFGFSSYFRMNFEYSQKYGFISVNNQLKDV